METEENLVKLLTGSLYLQDKADVDGLIDKFLVLDTVDLDSARVILLGSFILSKRLGMYLKSPEQLT